MRTGLLGFASALYARPIAALSLFAGLRKNSTMLRTGMRSAEVPHGSASVLFHAAVVHPPISWRSPAGSGGQVADVVSRPSMRRFVLPPELHGPSMNAAPKIRFSFVKSNGPLLNA